MAEKFMAGALLIKEGTALPEQLQLESEPYLKGWRWVKNLDSPGMDRRLCDVGWTFFLMAGDVKGTALGSDLEKATRRAVKSVIAGMNSKKLNCLEIVQVAASRFWGLPRVTVSGHARHIQESVYMFHTKRLVEWEQAKLATA